MWYEKLTNQMNLRIKLLEENRKSFLMMNCSSFRMKRWEIQTKETLVLFYVNSINKKKRHRLCLVANVALVYIATYHTHTLN